MVYGYNNEELIDKSYKLLEKLDKKGLWKKDTLVIGMDKSSRPLAFTLKKLSNLEKRHTPDFKFFNYSCRKFTGDDFSLIADELKRRVDPNKLPNYKNVLILDEHIFSGNTLKNAREIFKSYFSGLKKKPKIFPTTLGKVLKNSSVPGLIFLDGKQMSIATTSATDTGMRDRYSSYEMDREIIQESMRNPDKEIYKDFVKNRKQLSKEIVNYVDEKNLEEASEKGDLERIIKPFSIILLISGIFLGTLRLTGNMIGTSSFSNISGAILICLGVFGLFFSRKLRN